MLLTTACCSCEIGIVVKVNSLPVGRTNPIHGSNSDVMELQNKILFDMGFWLSNKAFHLIPPGGGLLGWAMTTWIFVVGAAISVRVVSEDFSERMILWDCLRLAIYCQKRVTLSLVTRQANATRENATSKCDTRNTTCASKATPKRDTILLPPVDHD